MKNPTYTTLIDPAGLAALLQSGPAPAILDASFDLGDVEAGARSFRAGHLPGSHHVDLDRDLCAPKSGTNGRHPLPGRADFARTIGALGITPETQIVVLDRQGGAYAARLWWMLRWLGHAAVAVLDGGLEAWRASGGAITADPPAAPQPAGPYPEQAPLAATIDAPRLERQLGRIGLVDARAPERFRGEKEPIDAVAGHIPGALNRFHKANLQDDGRFKPAERLRAEFEATLGARAPGEVVHSCGSGVTACHNLLAMEHAGLAGSLLYPGSWSEWSADPARAIARG